MTAGVFKSIISNLIRLITLLVAVTITSFFLVSLSPIDPVQAYVGAGVAVSPEQRENIGETWGLDKSPPDRFKSWFEAILKGDFGVSLIYRRSVIDIIQEKFINSISLMALAWVLSGIVGYILGIIMGLYKESLLDRAIKSLCLLLLSTPSFWIGILFIMVFSVYLGWFPIGLSLPMGEISSEISLATRIHHMILPVLTLSIASFGQIALHTREKIISVLQSDYVLFARARGRSDYQIIKDHGIRNTLIPIITLQFSFFGELFAGSILVEQVFSYPGLGLAAVQAGLRSDVPLLLGITIFSALFVFTGNTIANIIYGVIDPKILEGDYD
ncbi:MAG: ABC transporter permease [Tissierellaceae bacterium]|nr:ABC transporter permease [Tissierellaceae bacterium]